MDAHFLRALFDSVYVLALAAWAGSTSFLTFGIAPVLWKEPGEKPVRDVLARHAAWGTLCGALALAAAMGVPLSFPELRGPRVLAQAGAILMATLIMLYSGNSLTPALAAALCEGPEGAPRVGRLRRRWSWFNGVVLAIVVGLLVAFANRPAPRTAGIVEPSPRERARREAEALKAKAVPRPLAPADRH